MAMSEEKNLLRTKAKEKRKQITSQRRKEASENVLKFLLPRLEDCSLVLSFASFGDEIDLWPLNRELLRRDAFCLLDSSLCVFKVENIPLQLRPSGSGFLESNSRLSQPIDIRNLDGILVPGLLFDHDGYRIGYGRGHFDMLLSKVSAKTLVFGVGFLEQLSSFPLPREPHDVPVKELFLL